MLIASFGLIMVLVILGYCAWRIQITSQWLHDHRAYIQARDVRWESYIERTERNQAAILERLSRIEAKP